MSSLFRPEVIENRQSQWLGSIQLLRPVSLHVLTLLAVSAAVLVAAYLWIGEYTRKAHVKGFLAPDRGLMRLMSPQSATVLESRAVEGASVRAGDVLYVLSVDAANVSGNVRETLTARERSLLGAARQQAELERERAQALDRQVGTMRGELAQIDAEARLHEQRLALANQALARLESLRADNFISAAQVQAKSEELLGLQAQAQSLQRQRAAQLREIEQLLARRRELPLQTQVAQGELERDMAEIAQQQAENDSRRRIEIRAPQDGTVTGVVAQPGQSVNASVALASLLPADARLQAHLFAPSSAVGFVKPEQPVLLRYQAFPYQKFGLQSGQVAQVSRSPLQASELAGVPLPKSDGEAEPLYRITVTLDKQAVAAYGREQALVPGMQLEADVLLDRRRLIEWIFEPLLGLASRV
ncbi:HlyD family efflux transporter periplasmic adaptor subunit [Piscinibacter sp.]|uniref:HlyD family secretion protein n=1 Tax=Piscinibacter sp. TaxID=1903157 RepID=UPI001D4E73AF|nr:HlyD family efflux transporter periplasmic adaptor subunit [Piscinibacter sp.]MBK7531680.1 HlyD family efflux transporter periplasmic adaptor subunit [Piscinibacter sp.]